MSSGKRISEHGVHAVPMSDFVIKRRSKAAARCDDIFRRDHPLRHYCCPKGHVSHRTATQDQLYFCKPCFAWWKPEQVVFDPEGKDLLAELLVLADEHPVSLVGTWANAGWRESAQSQRNRLPEPTLEIREGWELCQ